ncbi:MAG: NUDIX domain-containing protein [Patescibacteria group bacterium]
MEEYKFENGDVVDMKQLEAPPIIRADYNKAHQGLVIPCHDVFIQCEGGILLVRRLDFPAKNILWPLGGRIERGKTIEDSLRKKIRDEAGLELGDIVEIGYARTFFKTDPFGHNRGTDTINFVFFGRGKGTLSLDESHKNPTIVLPRDYYTEYRDDLHPYVRRFMDLVIPMVK